MKTRITMLVFAYLSVALPATAQDTVPMYTPDFAGNMAWQGMVADQVERDSERIRGISSSQRAASASTDREIRSVVTKYRASPEVTERVKRQFAEFAGANGGSAVVISQAMESSDWMTAWADHVAVDGLRRGDVVDSVTAYFVQNWQIANNVQSTSRNQVQAVRRQIAPIISNDPGFARMNDAQKQEMSEAMMLDFIAQGTAFSYASAKGDRSMMTRLGDAAVTRFRNEMGVNLRQLRLTDQGFVSGD